MFFLLKDLKNINMYKRLCDEYNSYFNVGTALCSFFLMNENDVGLYIENIKSCLLQIKNSNKNIEIVPDIEKLRNDTLEVLNYAKQMQLWERMLQVFKNLKQKMIKGLQKIKRQKVQKVLDVIQ